METKLQAISPIDGRYASRVSELSDIFSEYGLIRRRVDVEIEYFIFLSTLLPELRGVTSENIYNLRQISKNFNIEEAKIVKNIESHTHHDVKAVEYYLRIKFEDLELQQYIPYIHFGLTSEDVNSVVYVLQLWDFRSTVYSDKIHKLLEQIAHFGEMYKDVPMLSRTHGQAATPTTVGKEFLVYYERLSEQYKTLRSINFKTKFGGAVGRLNAHHVAYPDIDWNREMGEFIKHYSHRKGFMMTRNRYTTQIDHYENYATIYDIIRRINTVLIDFCVDMWLYISRDYFSLRVVEGEVGSSAMPHKVNPIHFENAEGNLALANANLNFLSTRLPVSRLQRDLTGSTVMRNVGTVFAHTILSYTNILTGLDRITLNETVVLRELNENSAIISEAIQSVLRSRGYKDAYESVKEFVRGNPGVTLGDWAKFINGLTIDGRIKERLLNITPINYVGI